jgi:HK97 gp10 family phage protein
MADGIAIIGMDAIKAQLKALHANLSGKLLRDALYAAAGVYKTAIETATPTGREVYNYLYRGKHITIKSKRPIGQARASVIIYERQKRRAVAQTAEQLSLLVGFERKKAFYMYWYEYGKQGQAPRPFFRSTCDASEAAALAAAEEVISKGVEAI